MNNEQLHRHKKRVCLILALWMIVGLLILAACTAPYRTEAFHSKDGLEFLFTYEGVGAATFMTFKSGAGVKHSFDTDGNVHYEYHLEDSEQEYAIVYSNRDGLEYEVFLHLWKSKDPNRPVEHTPQSAPKPKL